MKNLKNLLWFILLIVIIYIMLVFIKPQIADTIAWTLWIKNINESITNFKEKLDYVSTKIPTKDEVQNAYSGAKNTIWDIKDNIENIRETADDLENKYNNTKEFINETGEKIEKAKQKLNDIQKIWDDISNMVNKNAIE